MSMEHALSVLLDHSKEAEVVGLQSKTHLLSLHSSSSSSPNEVVYSHQAHQTSLESSAEQQQQQQQQQMNSSRSNSSGSCLEHVGAFSNRFDLNGTNGRRRHNHATSTAITANGKKDALKNTEQWLLVVKSNERRQYSYIGLDDLFIFFQEKILNFVHAHFCFVEILFLVSKVEFIYQIPSETKILSFDPVFSNWANLIKKV